jgi:hypothetical protein
VADNGPNTSRGTLRSASARFCISYSSLFLDDVRVAWGIGMNVDHDIDAKNRFPTISGNGKPHGNSFEGSSFIPEVLVWHRDDLNPKKPRKHHAVTTER